MTILTPRAGESRLGTIVRDQSALACRESPVYPPAPRNPGSSVPVRGKWSSWRRPRIQNRRPSVSYSLAQPSAVTAFGGGRDRLESMAHITTGRLSPEVGIALRGTGSALPVRVMTNAEFEQSLDTTDEWITTRTGIRCRHVAGPGETTASLGLEASRRALQAANMSPQEIDLIVCATVTPEMMFPSTACFLQAGLGCRMIGAFDLLAACSGFLYALVVGSQFIHTGAYRNVLVVGSETLTRITDYADRASCILFGDGAGAAVLSATEDPTH